MGMTLLFAVAMLVSVAFASASHETLQSPWQQRAGPFHSSFIQGGYGDGYFAPVVPRPPRFDPYIRTGGFFGSYSAYVPGLRYGAPTHNFIGFQERQIISCAYYPQDQLSGPFGQRSRWPGYSGCGQSVGGTFGFAADSRQGGFFGTRTSGFRGFSGGDFTFNGGSYLGRGTGTAFY